MHWRAQSVCARRCCGKGTANVRSESEVVRRNVPEEAERRRVNPWPRGARRVRCAWRIREQTNLSIRFARLSSLFVHRCVVHYCREASAQRVCSRMHDRRVCTEAAAGAQSGVCYDMAEQQRRSSRHAIFIFRYRHRFYFSPPFAHDSPCHYAVQMRPSQPRESQKNGNGTGRVASPPRTLQHAKHVVAVSNRK